jgi:hypothetical protein
MDVGINIIISSFVGIRGKTDFGFDVAAFQDMGIVHPFQIKIRTLDEFVPKF